MEFSTNLLIFSGLALLMMAAAFAAVTTSRIMRAVTYLLFVLFGTAGLYFMLHYTFLGAVQIIVYAGGIVVLFIFAALLIGKGTIDVTHTSNRRYLAGLLASLSGMALALYLINSTDFFADEECRIGANGHSQAQLCADVRGAQHPAFGLYGRSHYDCT